jgi:hypothetical protein
MARFGAAQRAGAVSVGGTVLGLGLLGFGLLAWVEEVHGQSARAGLVVQLGDGTVHERCVELGGAERTGQELLDLAGLAPVAEVSALGATMCRIGGEGCDYPREPCWCHCQELGEGCTYWAYHILRDGRWVYSSLGASARIVHDGDVDGWAWGSGGEGSGATPPLRTFEELCAAPPAEATATGPARPTAKAPSATDTPRPAATEAQAVPLLSDQSHPAPTTPRQERTRATQLAAVDALLSLLATQRPPAPRPASTAAGASTTPSSTATLVAARRLLPPAPRSGPPAPASQDGDSNPLGYAVFAAITVALLAGWLWLRGRSA